MTPALLMTGMALYFMFRYRRPILDFIRDWSQGFRFAREQRLEELRRNRKRTSQKIQFYSVEEVWGEDEEEERKSA